MKMEIPNVVVTGSVAFDNIMSMPSRFKDHILPEKIHILNVGFIMETYEREFGGTGGNIAYTLALLGMPNFLVGSVGKDFSSYRRHLSTIKDINISGIKVYKSLRTAHGFVMTDQDDNQIWSYYEGAMKKSSELKINAYLDSNSFLIIAPNDPKAMVLYSREAVKSGTRYIFDPAFNIPHLSVKDLMYAVKHASIIVGNDYEISLIRKRLKISDRELASDNKILITTLGPKGSIIKKGGERYKIIPASPKNTSDPTGAGDAYRAGFLAGYLRGLSLPVCGRMGSVAAVYTVEKYGTQTHKFTLKDFKTRYKKNFKENLEYH